MTQHTFVIPVYGESPFLEECVQSLLKQSAADNVLMATSTPTKYSRFVADKYNVPYLVNPQRNAGIAGDWNFALYVADAPWVTIAHQDDIYHPKYREEIIQATKGRDDALIAFTDYTDLIANQPRNSTTNRFVKRTLLLPFALQRVISSKLTKRLMLMPGCPICCPSVAFHKTALANFKFDNSYKCALDWEAWLRLSESDGAFVYVNKPLVMHRIHQQSETVTSIDNGLREKEERQILEKIWGRFLSLPVAQLYALGHLHNKR